LREDPKNQTPETRYLLGKLSKEEETRFEEHYFADDAAFEEIGLAEDELIDAYVRGDLSHGDRERFEKSLVNSEGLVERVEFARVLSTSISAPALPCLVEKDGPGWWGAIVGSFTQRPAFRMVFAGCFLILLAGAVALFFDWTRLRNESRLLKTERAALGQQKEELARQISDQQSRAGQLAVELQNERSASDKLNQELQQAKDQLAKSQLPASPAIASILLFPGLSRGAEVRNQLAVPAGATTIQLKLALDTDEYNNYRVSIRSSDGREVFSPDQLKAQGPRSARIILCNIPPGRLVRGEYVVTVSGRTSSGSNDSVADYAFRLIRK
jgi:hypothetical protein